MIIIIIIFCSRRMEKKMQKMSDFVPCGRNLFLAVNMIAAMATLSKYEYNCGLAGKMIQFA